MSTTVVQPESASTWKQEVSQRIAAHKSRRGYSAAQQPTPAPNWTAASSRAAEAAARVAARYANAPSYSQLQIAVAPGELPVDEASAPAPRNETIAIAPPLPEREAPHTEESLRSVTRDREPSLPPAIAAAPSTLEDWENECAHSHWEPDQRLRPVVPLSSPLQLPAVESEAAPIQELVSPSLATSFADSASRARWEWPELARGFSAGEEIEPVEPDLPIHANLIEFPRELIATRRMRPRRAEGLYATARPEAQLSIFEVDPCAVSTRPESAAATALAAWPEPAWAEIELEPQGREETEAEEMPTALQGLQLAPIGRRLVAPLVDAALIATILLGPALVVASRFGHSRPTKIAELGAVLVILLAGMLYHTLCLLLAGATPGMNLAGISLCTFDDQIPTRDQLRSRLGALLLSLLPVGLGIAWALFDEDHLSWHDRLSKTYLRAN